MYDNYFLNPFLDNTNCEPHFLTRGRQGADYFFYGPSHCRAKEGFLNSLNVLIVT
jgi:hypothetical protein